MMMTPKERLQAARDLIADPTKWTKRVLARDKYGNTADPIGDDAVCFCAYGAIEHVSCNGSTRPADVILERVCDRLRGALPYWVNDQLGHAAILAAFDEAINDA